jgi:hypothetical protein
MATIADMIGASITQLQQAQAAAVQELIDLTAARADDQTQLTKIAVLTKQVADLQAVIDAQPPTAPVVTEFSGFGFNQSTVGMLLPFNTKGKGRDVDIRRMKPGSSKYTPAKVPLSTRTPKTNLLQAFLLNGLKKPGATLEDVTLQITEQGHEHHGLGVVDAPGLVQRNFKIEYTGTVTDLGSSGTPPHEVFLENVNRCDGIVLENPEMDGHGKTSTVLGFNNMKGSKITGGYIRGSKNGMNVTWWNTSGENIVEGTDASHGRKPFNSENNGQADGFEFTEVDVRNRTYAKCHFSIAANNGSTPYIFHDMITDPGQPFIVWGPFYPGRDLSGSAADAGLEARFAASRRAVKSPTTRASSSCWGPRSKTNLGGWTGRLPAL